MRFEGERTWRHRFFGEKALRAKGNAMSKKEATMQARLTRKEVLAADAIVCPFCGRVSQSKDHCTVCHTLFSKEVLSVARTVESDSRSDKVGPLSTKWAKRALWVGMVLLVCLFVIITEMTGQGLSSMGK